MSSLIIETKNISHTTSSILEDTVASSYRLLRKKSGRLVLQGCFNGYRGLSE